MGVTNLRELNAKVNGASDPTKLCEAVFQVKKSWDQLYLKCNHVKRYILWAFIDNLYVHFYL